MARILNKSEVMGEFCLNQWAPPSVVRNMVPELPTIQQTCSVGADPASNSAVTPLDCSVQVVPLSLDTLMKPLEPRSQRSLSPGALTTREFGVLAG